MASWGFLSQFFHTLKCGFKVRLKKITVRRVKELEITLYDLTGGDYTSVRRTS